MRSGEDLLFDGTLSADLAGQCARCLEEFPLALSRPFSWVLLPAGPQGVLGRETELNQEDLAASFYSGDTVDVSLLVREQFFLSLPSYPLCQETCKGLCEQCGVNLNSEECSCSPGWTDPRLAALATLRLPARVSSEKTEKAPLLAYIFIEGRESYGCTKAQNVKVKTQPTSFSPRACRSTVVNLLPVRGPGSAPPYLWYLWLLPWAAGDDDRRRRVASHASYRGGLPFCRGRATVSSPSCISR